MASIKLEVEVDEVDNENLGKIEDQVYQVLSTECRRMASGIAGNVTNVTETDRTEDENEEPEE